MPAKRTLETSIYTGDKNLVGSLELDGDLRWDPLLGAEKVTNGTFTGAATDWTLGSGWAYSSNTVVKNADGTATLSQNVGAVDGELYRVVYTISGWSVGTCTMAVGGVSGTARSADGTYTEYITATGVGSLTFTPSNTARFTVDDISVKRVGVTSTDRVNVWSGDRIADGVAQSGKTGLFVETEDGTRHFLGDRVGLGTGEPVAGLDSRGVAIFVHAGTDRVPGNAFNFIVSRAETTLYDNDYAGMALRNADTTNDNYAYLSFQSNDTGGNRYLGAGIAAVFGAHGTAGNDRHVNMIWHLQTHNGNFNQIMQLNWDLDQGGAALGLGIVPPRQGLILKTNLPLAWYESDNTTRDVSWKQGNLLRSLQIGDNFSDNGTAYYITAPIVAAGYTDKTGGDLVFHGGAGTGTGIGGAIKWAVAPPAGGSASTTNALVNTIELTGSATPAFRPVTDDVTPLGDSTHRWNAVYLGTGISLQGAGSAYGSSSQTLELNAIAAGGGLALNTWRNANAPAVIEFNKSKGAAAGTHGIVSNGETMGYVVWNGSDGSAFENVAQIGAAVDSGPSAGNLPGRFMIWTATGGNLVEAMRINSSQRVGIGQTTITALLHLKAGAAAASSAPLKFATGPLLTTPEAGAVEHLGDGFYVTPTTTVARQQVATDSNAVFYEGEIVSWEDDLVLAA